MQFSLRKGNIRESRDNHAILLDARYVEDHSDAKKIDYSKYAL